MPQCLEYAKERTDNCARWEVQGYSSCASWSPWFAWICLFWTWISNLVCVAWVWVTTEACLVWDVVTTVVNAVVEFLEAAFSVFLNGLALLVELIFAIPFVGRIIRWLWNLILTIVWVIVGLVDAVLYIINVRPQKKLRVCTIILLDETGHPVAPVQQVVNVLNDAIRIFHKEMNIQIVNSQPMQITSGFRDGPFLADQSWVKTMVSPSSTGSLDTRCDAAGFGEDLTTVGSERELSAINLCFWGNFRRLIGYGAPVVIYVLRSIDRGRTGGCGLGPFTDYVTLAATFAQNLTDNDNDGLPDNAALRPGSPALDGSQGTPLDTLAHELGHISNLTHVGNLNNLMFASSRDPNPPNARRGTRLTVWQGAIVRSSRHVTYF